MTHFKLYDFQSEALRKLIYHTNFAIEFNQDKRILLKSPTGSGKTIIMGSYIDKMLEGLNRVSFVWICETPNLTMQSHRKLEKFFEFTTRTFDESRIRESLENHSVTFINWEKIKENRIGTKTGDLTTSLVDLCRQTKSEGKKLVFIIDEAHTNANSAQSKEQVRLCDPDAIIDVTATPNVKRVVDREVKIDVKDVQAAEIIKSSVVLNYDQTRYNDEDYREKHHLTSFKDFIVHRSIELRDRMEEKIRNHLEEVGEKPYVPLLLIQIPSNSKKHGDVLPELEAFLKTKGYERNVNLAVYQSEDYSDELENIGNDEKYKILIFKSAIAKGWDCPRASILTMLRDPKTKSFTTQTIGRIMRVPRLEYFPVEFNWLNKGYIYIESSDNKIINDYVKDIENTEEIKAVQVKLKDEFLDTIRIETKRWKNEYQDGLISLQQIENELLWKIEREDWLAIDKDLIQQSKEVNTGEYGYESVIDGKYVMDKESINLSIKDRVLRYQSTVKTMKINKDILHKIETTLMEKHGHDELLVNDIIYTFHKEIDRIYQSLEESYSKPIVTRKQPFVWEPLETKEMKSSERREDLDGNYAYEQCYGKFNGLEEKLALMLSKGKTVEYWLRNDDSGKSAFPIPYVLNNKYRHFHPDFISKINGEIYVLETKGKDGEEEAHVKYQYLKELEHENGYKVGFVKEINGVLHIYNGNDLRKDYGENGNWQKLIIE